MYTVEKILVPQKTLAAEWGYCRRCTMCIFSAYSLKHIEKLRHFADYFLNFQKQFVKPNIYFYVNNFPIDSLCRINYKT